MLPCTRPGLQVMPGTTYAGTQRRSFQRQNSKEMEEFVLLYTLRQVSERCQTEPRTPESIQRWARATHSLTARHQ